MRIGGDVGVATLAMLPSFSGCRSSARSARDVPGWLRWCAGQLSLCEGSGFEPCGQQSVLGSVLLWRCWGCYPWGSSPTRGGWQVEKLAAIALDVDGNAGRFCGLCWVH